MASCNVAGTFNLYLTLSVGTANPYSALMDISLSFEALTTTKPVVQGMQRTYDVGVSLEDLYFGCSKIVKHNRKTQADPGGPVKDAGRCTGPLSRHLST